MYRCTIFGKIYRTYFKTAKIIKKPLGTFFLHLQALTVKFQKKVMNGFREKRDGRTNGQTRLLRSQRETKKETGFPGIPAMAKFRPNLSQFWPKWVIFEFSPKKRNRHVFSIFIMHRCTIFGNIYHVPLYYIWAN